jgi:hypothetical protein
MAFIVTAVSILLAAAIGVLVLAVVLARSLKSPHPGLPPAQAPLGPALEGGAVRKEITR